MNQVNRDKDEMRPEYDIRGGVRGKYVDRYQEQRVAATVTIVLADSPFIVNSSVGSPRVGSFTWSAQYVPPQPSPSVQTPKREGPAATPR